MTNLALFGLAVLALLATPGPTNTLMAAAGAQRGVIHSLPLLAGELGGYIVSITLWSEIVGAAAARQPAVPAVAKSVAVAFLLWSAFKLWHDARRNERQPVIKITKVFVTTVLNPKGLIFAFAIFPSIGFMARLQYLGIHSILVAFTGIGWMALGASMMRLSKGAITAFQVQRCTALVLSIFATLLLAQLVQGIFDTPE